MNALERAMSSVEPINNFERDPGLSRGVLRPPCAESRRRVMDIEEVLAWAFRDELPKNDGLGGNSYGPPGYSCPLGRMVAIGAVVDNWNREPGHPAAMGPPHPDAFVVSAAVEELAAMADQAIDGKLDLVLDFGVIGEVDEAAAVRRALTQLPAIVARCAKMGVRPSWRATPAPMPTHTSNGRVQVVRWASVETKIYGGETFDEQQLVPVSAEGRDSYLMGSYCPVQYEPSLQCIADERAEYLVWWGALDALALALTGRLVDISVLPPLAPQKPWRDEMVPVNPPLVLNDRDGRAFRRESRETAAAHRMLGHRRAQNLRGGALSRTAPKRLVPMARPAKKACAPV